MKQNEKIIVIVAVALAAVAVIAFVMIRSGGGTTSTPIPGATSDQSQSQAPAGPGGMGSAGTNSSKPAGKPTPVPKGVTLSQYLTKVYTLVKEKNYKEAFKLYPPAVQAAGFQSFNSSRQSMPVTTFKVGSEVTKGNTATVAVTQVLGGQAQNTKWIVSWHFEKKNGQWGVVSYDVSMAQ